jgi:hypothetical protein
MIDVNKLKIEFAEKLLKSGSMDEALLKVVWVAYKQGFYDKDWNETHIDIIGQNGEHHE